MHLPERGWTKVTRHASSSASGGIRLPPAKMPPLLGITLQPLPGPNLVSVSQAVDVIAFGQSIVGHEGYEILAGKLRTQTTVLKATSCKALQEPALAGFGATTRALMRKVRTFAAPVPAGADGVRAQIAMPPPWISQVVKKGTGEIYPICPSVVGARRTVSWRSDQTQSPCHPDPLTRTSVPQAPRAKNRAIRLPPI